MLDLLSLIYKDLHVIEVFFQEGESQGKFPSISSRICWQQRTMTFLSTIGLVVENEVTYQIIGMKQDPFYLIK